jgi:hypothetical protein
MIAGPQRSEAASPRIFLIGFNKCGTTSFHNFFLANGLSSVHWRANTLAMTIHRHLKQGHRPLLDGLDHWTAYTDMICIPGSPWGRSNSTDQPVIEACRYFRQIHQSYPNSLFILNTRDVEGWIESRLRHDNGRFARAYLEAVRASGIANLDDLCQLWLRDWTAHHAEVSTYFQDSLQDHYLYFHLTDTPASSLFNFLGRHFSLSSFVLPHHHQTTV